MIEAFTLLAIGGLSYLLLIPPAIERVRVWQHEREIADLVKRWDAEERQAALEETEEWAEEEAARVFAKEHPDIEIVEAMGGFVPRSRKGYKRWLHNSRRSTEWWIRAPSAHEIWPTAAEAMEAARLYAPTLLR